MNKIWIVTKNELLRYFQSPLAYIYLLSFLILNGSFAIYFGNFFHRGQANLLAMFEFQPWLYLLFIPGIAMRLWSEEFRNKTIIQIITMPISVTALVWGKFLAAWLFCGLALLLTATFWLSVNWLGTPDNSVILLGYLASFTIAGCMLAISQTMSALTKNQVIALVLAVIANLAFFWSGIEYILAFCRLFMSDFIIDTIASFSFLSRFASLSRGLLELRDVIYFISIIFFFNFTTVLIINYKTSGTSGWLKSTSRTYFISAWLMLLVGLFGINMIANSLTRNIQYDATQEKFFTLAPATRQVLQQLPEPITAKLYFSPILEQRNSDLRLAFDRIRLLLQKYKSVAPDKFQYKIYYPKFLSQEEDVALAAGVQPIPLIDLNQNALFGLTLEDTLQNKEVIPFFTQNNLGAIEQSITEKIYQMHHHKKTVGILTNLPVFGETLNNGNALQDSWQFINELQQTYNVVKISADDDLTQPLDALMIIDPQDLSDDTVAKIKKYSQQGGKILLLLDPAHEASRLYSFKNQPLQASNLGELEKFWGIKLYLDYVVADLQNSITVDATIDYAKNPVFSQDIIQFRIPQSNMNPYHQITQNLHEMIVASTSVIAPQPEAYKNGSIKFTPLLKAGDISAIMTAKVVTDGLNPQQVLEYFSADDNQKILAAEIRGQQADNPFTLIAIGDSDFIYDSFWMNKDQFLQNNYVSAAFDNMNFVLNSLDYLTGDELLASLRGKQLKDRRFNDIEKLRRLNSFHYKKAENQIFTQMYAAQENLQKILQKRNFEERENFTADELTTIAQIKQQLASYRQNLSDLRYQAFADIQKISHRITFFNIALIPLLLSLLLALKYFWKTPIRNSAETLRLNRRWYTLAGICLALLICGLITTYCSQRSEIDTFENKAVFPDLKSQINEVNKLILKNNRQTLTFYRALDGDWHLKEHPLFLVYQDRIRRLLITMQDATFFAKKSAKAENLKTFNLEPLEQPNSKVTQISLLKDEQILQHFYVGDINVDLGRGSSAAYMRFEDQFQVWLINADFVSLDLDWHNWTYSHLWDLRYGRFVAPSSAEKEQQRLMILMKELLNTPIRQISVLPKEVKQPLKTISLQVENGGYVSISLYKDNKFAYAYYQITAVENNDSLQEILPYLNEKTAVFDLTELEKILNVFNIE